MPRLATLLILLGTAGSAMAQTTDERLWINLTFQERAGTASPWRWYFELQGRTRDGLDTVDQVIVRPAVGYDLTPRSSVWAGHGYTPGYPATGGELTENRAWQQYLWAGPALGGVSQVRTRFEQRWIEGGGSVAWRYRQFVRLQKPIARRAGLAIVGWNEIFVHMNDTGRTIQGVDQNRVFGGVGMGLGRHRLEVGYVNQAIRVPDGPNRQNHVLLVFLNAAL